MLYFDLSLVMSPNPEMLAWAPIKKSGSGEFLVPVFFLYLRNAFPAKNKASRGTSKTLRLRLETAFSTSSMLLNPMDISV